MPVRGVGVRDGCCREGLPDALDSDGDVVDERRRALRLAQGLGVGLVILHVVDLDEEVFVVRASALGGVGDAVTVGVNWHTEPDVDHPVAVEIDAAPARLPAVGETVAVRVDDVPIGVEAAHARNCAGLARSGSPEPRCERGKGHPALKDDRARGQAAGEGRELEGDHPVAVVSPPGPQRIREQVLPGLILVERHRVAGEARRGRVRLRGRANPVAVRVPWAPRLTPVFLSSRWMVRAPSHDIEQDTPRDRQAVGGARSREGSREGRRSPPLKRTTLFVVNTPTVTLMPR